MVEKKAAGSHESIRWNAGVVVANLLVWLVAAFLCLLQYLGTDTMGTRLLSIVGILATTTVWAFAGLLRVPVKRTWKHFFGSVIVMLSILFFCLPLRIFVALSRSSMDDIANKLDQGRTFESSHMVGLIRVEKVEMWNGMACLWTDPLSGDHTGYCRLKQGDPAERVNEWSICPLGGGWYHIVED